jgi:Family of unknown function (DUF6134)
MADRLNALPGPVLWRRGAWALVAGVGLLLAGAGQARAADVETRDFTIQVDGKAAGEYHMTIRRQDDGTVSLAAQSEVHVSVLLVNVYTYAYRGLEVWKGGRLQHFESSGKENGKPFVVTADADPAGLRVKANGEEHAARADVWTTSFWQLPPAQYRNQVVPLLRCDSGQESSGQMQQVGAERVKVAGQEQTCVHYRVMRDVPYELWYDGQERLVRQEWVSKGHRTVLELVRVGH